MGFRSKLVLGIGVIYGLGIATGIGLGVVGPEYGVSGEAINNVRNKVENVVTGRSEKEQVIDDLLENPKLNADHIARIFSDTKAYMALTKDQKLTHSRFMMSEMTAGIDTYQDMLRDGARAYCERFPTDCLSDGLIGTGIKAYDRGKELVDRHMK